MHSHRTELNCGSVSSTGVHSIDRWRQDASSKKLGLSNFLFIFAVVKNLALNKRTRGLDLP